MSKNNYLNIFFISWSWIIAGLLNYIYHPIILNYISIEEFWEFGSLVWILNILWILTTWLILFLNKEVSKNINDLEKIKYIHIETSKTFFYIWLIIFIIYILFIPLISVFLKIDSYLIIFITWIWIILSFVWISYNAILRGLKKFEILSFLTILNPIIKLVLWFWLVILWYWIYWAIYPFIMSSILATIYSYYYLYTYFKDIKSRWKSKDLINDFKKNKNEIFHFFLISLFLTFLINIDTILAKNIFDAKQAWIYAWVSVLWKFLIFLILSIETVYYGQIMEYKKEETPKHLLINPTVLILITFLVWLISNIFIWWFILKILKAELVDYKNIYIYTIVFYWLVAFISFFSKVLIWWWKFYVNYIMLLLCILLVFVTYTFWKTSLEYFIYNFIGISIVGIIVLWWLFLREVRKVK